MRKLAAFAAHERPALLAICEMPSGDSLSLATRFALQWAYRGRLALFWTQAFAAYSVHDEQRGFLRVDGALDGTACTIAAARFSRERQRLIPQTRFARAQLRKANACAVFFAQRPARAEIFADLGFHDVTPEGDAGERIYLRAIDPARVRVLTATV